LLAGIVVSKEHLILELAVSFVTGFFQLFVFIVPFISFMVLQLAVLLIGFIRHCISFFIIGKFSGEMALSTPSFGTINLQAFNMVVNDALPFNVLALLLLNSF
jgi:hypothetical protein